MVATIDSSQPHDLGDVAVDLWHQRYVAEGDVLACLCASPRLVQDAKRLGVCDTIWDWEPNWCVWKVLTARPDATFEDHLRWACQSIEHRGWSAWYDCADLFDLWPDESSRRNSAGDLAELTEAAGRLRASVVACRDAERHLAIAKQKMRAAVAACQRSKHRGPAGSSGDKHPSRRTLVSAPRVKRSA